MEVEEQVDKDEAKNVDAEVDNETSGKTANVKPTFKKPTAIIGPRRGPLAKTSKEPSKEGQEETPRSEEPGKTETENKPVESPLKDPGFTYTEPSWGGKPEKEYSMEVLKSGTIAETISLNDRSFHVIGRLPVCDISLAHPTISRYHAILQYRAVGDEQHPQGLYVYDLDSTHGTYWNGNRIKPRVYARVQGGHMLRFGFSQRKYILQAPPDDQEEESEYTLTELKQKKELEKRIREEEEQQETKEGKEADGIDWGMGEDADEETDLQENPYATSLDEELVLDDPKKTLRGWFEREGYDLQYRTEEKGIGQFLCWVDLPLENVTGHSVRAEALVKGKKKESVVQCALEACKILDRYGLLRQANHEARKRKVRNWEEQDYYDSDEDNFLDRTGSVEKKREQRMRLAGKLEEKVETYDSLLRKHEEVTKRIDSLSSSLNEAQNANSKDKEAAEEDELDAFMSTLNSKTLSKSDMAKMKMELNQLRKEEAKLVELLNLTRPANLPPLTLPKVTEEGKEQEAKKRRSDDSFKSRGGILHRALQKKQEPRRTAEVRSGSVNISQENTSEPEEESDSDSEETPEKKADEPRENVSEEKQDSKEKIEAVPKETVPTKKSQENQQKRESKSSKKHREKLRKTTDQELHRENYSMWVPPQDQEGDGKTSLNEKYGY